MVLEFFLAKTIFQAKPMRGTLTHVVQLVGPAHVSIALDYVFDMRELEEHLEKMKGTFPPGLGYEMGARFVPPEQLEEIVVTLQGWGYSDADLTALLGGNLLRLAKQVWKAPNHG